MIEAWFQRWNGPDDPEGDTFPVYMPNDEVVELAEVAGIPATDLFHIDIPGGASRPTRIRCLVSQSDINPLYQSDGPYGRASATFNWRDRDSSALYTNSKLSMNVVLLPPRPLWWKAEAKGLYIVEAVDVRHWWHQTRNIDSYTGTANAANDLFTSDGRFNTKNANASLIDILYLMRDECENLAGTATAYDPSLFSFDLVDYAPVAALRNRIADIELWPTLSLASRIDMLLSLTGYVLAWIPVPNALGQSYKVFKVENEYAKLDAMMSGAGADLVGKRAYVGGLNPTSAVTTPTDSLLLGWRAGTYSQVNRAVAKVGIEVPYRTPEGATDYHRSDPAILTDTPLSFPIGRVAIRDGVTVNTARVRQSAIGDFGTTSESKILPVFRESRPWQAEPDRETGGVDVETTILEGPTFPTPPVWDTAAFVTAVRDNYVDRLEVPFGRIAWAGWREMEGGCYRATMLRYTFAMRSRRFVEAEIAHPDVADEKILVPVTITVADEDDWILGPRPIDDADPRSMVFSKGLAHARRLSCGALMVDVAPPNTRVFAAEITGSEPHPTRAWNWVYSFKELEPTASAAAADWNEIGQFARKSDDFIAYNSMEYANIFTTAGAATNFIAPGVSQADYSAIIDAIPIGTGSVVMMVEQFSPNMPYAASAYSATPQNSDLVARKYWFCVPNAVKVTC
jgi:hypothetical protein